MNTQIPPDAPAQHRFHFFISHASEDKELWAKPLQVELEELGCQVWIDDEQMMVGDNLVQQINDGIRESKYIVAIISTDWLLKKWSTAERNAVLYQAVTRTINDAHGRILPIRHGITQEALASKVPLLGPLLTLSTETPVRRLAAALVRAISRPEQRSGARTTVDLRALSNTVPEPEGVEALDYLRGLAAAKQSAPVPPPPPKKPRTWPLLLFFCLAAAAVAGGSMTGRFNPMMRRLTIDLDNLQTTANGLRKQSGEQISTIADLTFRLQQAADAATKSAEEIRRLHANVEDTKKIAANRQKEIFDLTGQITDFSNQLTALNGENQQLKTRLDEGVGKQKQSAEQLKELRKQKEDHLTKADNAMRAQVNVWKATTAENDRLTSDLEATRGQLATARKESGTAKAQVNQLRTELQTLKDRSTGAKVVSVYANNSNIDVQDDPTATVEPEVLRGDGTNLSVTRPPGSDVLLLISGCCISVTADDMEGVKAAYPVTLQQARRRFHLQTW